MLNMLFEKLKLCVVFPRAHAAHCTQLWMICILQCITNGHRCCQQRQRDQDDTRFANRVKINLLPAETNHHDLLVTNYQGTCIKISMTSVACEYFKEIDSTHKQDN